MTSRKLLAKEFIFFSLQDHTLSPIRMPPFDSTSDLERSYSEKSIDEAILERTMSPASPAPSHDGKSPSQENEDSSFQRQYAKRGLKYSQRSSGGLEDDQVKGQYDESSEVRIPSPIRGQGSPSHSRSVFKRSQNSAVSMPSSDNMSASVLSSLGDSPYTSPTITPRSSRYTLLTLHHNHSYPNLTYFYFGYFSE